MRIILNNLAYNFVYIVYLADSCNRKGAVMRANEYGLRLKVADTADSQLAVHSV